jgi:gliding motility-associated-like protein
MKKIPAIASLFFREHRPMGRRLMVYYLACPVFFIAFLLPVKTNGQCPVNLGFESGNFTNWQCISGLINVQGVSTTYLTPPLKNRYTIYQKGSKELDRYGKFPVVCPNGSNYSIKLGNDSTGGEIDGLSYTITVPAGQDDYSIIYNYAVVYQNPDHPDFQQPRFRAKVFDVSANEYISCSSFDFVAASSLPGFRTITDSTFGRVLYKPWTSVSIKLLGYAGKKVRIEFTVNDCAIGAHFGYAYFDVSEDCGSLIKGNIICDGTTSTILQAPYGFETYNWFNGDIWKSLGTGNILRLDPIPPPGSKFAVEIIPYPGSGCRDTLYTTLTTSPVPFFFKAVDSVGVCKPGEIDLTRAFITQGSSADLRFTYFIDSNLVEFAGILDAINTSGTYYIRAANTAGCIDMRPVIVQIDTTPVFSVKDPPIISYPQTANLTDTSVVRGISQELSFSYWKDAAAAIGVSNPQAVQQVGKYYIKATTKYGCSAIQSVEVKTYIRQPPNAFSPNGDGINDVWDLPTLVSYPQCIVDIYDRSGHLIFHSVGYTKPWDGKFNGKLLPMATYYYIIKGTDNLQPVAGSVTIIY